MQRTLRLATALGLIAAAAALSWRPSSTDRGPAAPAPETPAGPSSASTAAERARNCTEFWRRAETPDAPKSAEAIRAQALALRATTGASAEGCGTGVYAKRLAFLERLFARKCGPVLGPPADQTAIDAQAFQTQCVGVLRFYARVARDYRTRETPLRELNDPGLLRDKAMVALLNLEGSGEASARTQALAILARLAQVAPKGAADRARLVRLLFEAAQTFKGSETATPSEALLTRTAAEAQTEFPDDGRWKIALLEQARLGGDGAALRGTAAALSAERPDAPEGPYYSAWSAFADHDVEGAKRILKRVVGRNPGYLRAQMTLTALEFPERMPGNDFFPPSELEWTGRDVDGASDTLTSQRQFLFE